MNEGINLDELTMCLLPFGTGNDFCQIMGWGKQPKDIWLSKLKALVSEIVNGQEEVFNVWDITVHLREDQGDIMQWDSKDKSKRSFQML